MPTLRSLLINRFYPPASPPENTSFSGKTILLTGATAGIGYAAAVKLLQYGCRKLILGVRSIERGEAARDRMVAEAGLKEADEANVLVWDLDQASFESIRDFARKANTEVERLDAVVLNAAVLRDEWHMTHDGWEETLEVNSLGTALLGFLLLKKLADGHRSVDGTHEPRLLFVSSGGVREADTSVLNRGASAEGEGSIAPVLQGLNVREGYNGRSR